MGMKIRESIPMFFSKSSQIPSTRKAIRTQRCAKTGRLRFFSILNVITYPGKVRSIIGEHCLI